MQVECHLAVGWLIGNLVPGNDRRFRALIAFSAVAPDLDGIPYLFGPDAYAHCHHVYGHNIFAGAAIALLCAALARPKWRVTTMLFAVLGFASHWEMDYYFSGWPLMTFWPISRVEHMYRPRIGLDHPINLIASYVSLIFLVASAWIWRRTVLESIWPALDRLLVGLTLPRNLTCAECGRPTGQRCLRCGKPICFRHGQVTRRLAICCGSCVTVLTDAASSSSGA